MTFRIGDRVTVDLPSGDTPGVVAAHYGPGLFLVEIDTPGLASVVVGPHRLRPAADPPAEAAAGG